MSKSQNATTSVPSELDGPSTSLDELAAELVLLDQVDDQLSKLNAARKALHKKIKDALGKTELGTVASVPVVTYKRVTSIVLDQAILKKNFPDVYEQCLDIVETRRFVRMRKAS
ncbi:hypothetical protein UK23_23810 [Lentzea aerocolonigenes]|uniref:Uncharacterized protein n=1 Tax=Lentzea aerocolonigenes TaxID=68170 RepID=A0A0F0GSR1_LENAE|nr:hypothetical protein [Lentzea aerocolonigenes]KJK46345.1 hypothetical protein UK23_23810 [Lentzea aerocolonigenes]